MPYFKRKLDVKFDVEREMEFMESQEQRQAHSTLRQWFRHWYPTVHAAWELSSLGYLVGFALQSSDYSSPWLHLAGLKLVKGAMPTTSTGPSQYSSTCSTGGKGPVCVTCRVYLLC